ncbi:serine/threonine protein kinase [Dispira parvispora]|uniref:Serine/threonine protein kinase n=1 Tax=Dispira parvispora TaxID=1520584 RepID=A0A9W8AMJ9_9FUNG|nr:serine/threonine protein kinase [Dispira parvispora]
MATYYESPLDISPTSTLCDKDHQEETIKAICDSPRTLANISQWFQRRRSSTKTRSNESTPSTTSSAASSPTTRVTHPLLAKDMSRVVMRRPQGYTRQTYGHPLRNLGAGTNGVVALHQRSEDGLKVAVKRLIPPKSALRFTDRAQRYMRQVITEANLTRTFQHRNIIATYDVLQEADGVFYTVMDYCPLDLFTLIQTSNPSQAEIDCYFAQIVHGLNYLHSQQRVAHRDLKLDNVCITHSGTAKLIDFGCATTSNPKYDPQQRSPAIIATGSCGSDTYMAPELFSHNIYDARKVDVWALAVIYIAMCTKHFPWDRATMDDSNFTIFTKHPDHILERMLPSQTAATPLLRRMLMLNPSERPSITTIMMHPWFRSIDVCKVSDCNSHTHTVPLC